MTDFPIDDFLRDLGALEGGAFKAALYLWRQATHPFNGGSLPGDAGAGEVLRSAGFVAGADGRWHQPLLEHLCALAEAKRAEKRRAGRAGGKASAEGRRQKAAEEAAPYGSEPRATGHNQIARGTERTAHSERVGQTGAAQAPPEQRCSGATAGALLPVPVRSVIKNILPNLGTGGAETEKSVPESLADEYAAAERVLLSWGPVGSTWGYGAEQVADILGVARRRRCNELGLVKLLGECRYIQRVNNGLIPGRAQRIEKPGAYLQRSNGAPGEKDESFARQAFESARDAVFLERVRAEKQALAEKN